MYKPSIRLFKESGNHMDAKDQVYNISYSPKTIFQDPEGGIFFFLFLSFYFFME